MKESRTFMAKKETVERNWYVIDAADMILGRMASQVARVLMGKHKPIYTPHVDTGDFVIVVNADKVRLTGNKLERKRVYRHTGHPGGIKSRTYGEMMAKRPDRLVEKVIRGMLPKGKLHHERKLKVYAGAVHPHSAQQPKPLEFQPYLHHAEGGPVNASD